MVTSRETATKTTSRESAEPATVSPGPKLLEAWGGEPGSNRKGALQSDEERRTTRSSQWAA